MAESRAVHDLVARVIRRLDVDARVAGPALRAPLPVWRRVLGFEGCTAQLDHRLRASSLLPRLPDSLRRMLRDETASAPRHGALALRQLADVAALAHRSGIRGRVLKGGARLLVGQEAGARSMSDVDLMVRPEDGVRFHRLLVTELGYASSGPPYPHHLPVLERAGSLNIDVHVR